MVCDCSKKATVLRSSKSLPLPSQRSAVSVADSLFVQSKSQIWKSTAQERRHLEQRRWRRRPGREILRSWEEIREWNLPPHRVYLLLRYLSITPSFPRSFQTPVIFATFLSLITGDFRAKCPSNVRSLLWTSPRPPLYSPCPSCLPLLPPEVSASSFSLHPSRTLDFLCSSLVFLPNVCEDYSSELQTAKWTTGVYNKIFCSQE